MIDTIFSIIGPSATRPTPAPQSSADSKVALGPLLWKEILTIERNPFLVKEIPYMIYTRKSLTL